MASKPKSDTSANAGRTTKALVSWEDELAKAADAASAMEANTGGGQFFSLRAGVLSWQDAPMPSNEMDVIILDHILENVYYDGKYDADTPQSPVCFAFGRDEKVMVPHQQVIAEGAQQNDTCTGCPMNEWGSADTGRGKACRNTRRLAMIPAGTSGKHGFELFDDDHFAEAVVGYMKLPVTSVKGFATYVKQLAATLRRPPFGVVTKVRVVPDQKSQFRVLFEAVENLPANLAATILDRRAEVEATIDFPYTRDEEQPKAQRGRGGKPAGRRPSRKY